MSLTRSFTGFNTAKPNAVVMLFKCKRLTVQSTCKAWLLQLPVV